MMKIQLPKTKAYFPADQCRRLGIKVGDTIWCRDTFEYGGWEEIKLTLLFLGKYDAMWKVMRRDSENPNWFSAREQSDWSLEGRQWWLVVPGKKNRNRKKES